MIQPHPAAVPSNPSDPSSVINRSNPSTLAGWANPSFVVVPAALAEGLDRDTTRRFCFRVSPPWRSPVLRNPHAEEAERRVIAWLEALGCTPSEVERARQFDIAGYVGIPFPTLPREQTAHLARYLSLWLLWDDFEVETLLDRWRFEVDDVLSGCRPEAMSRFEEGFWQLLTAMAEARSPRWMEDLCGAMTAWSAAAVEEALATRAYRERRVLPSFERHLEMRVATIGMPATALLLEHADGAELPREFHAHPAVRRLEWLASAIVGLGNEILSLGKDLAADQYNLVTTLMAERALDVDQAVEALVRMHDDALVEFDAVADALSGPEGELTPTLERWLDDMRYASVGFSLWASQAPRYTAHRVVARDVVIEPRFSFFPPPRPADPPSSPWSWRGLPPTSNITSFVPSSE